MTDDQILDIATCHGFFPAMLAGGASAVAGKPEQFLPMLRAIEQASRRAAIDRAAKECDELEALALEDMALEKDERFGVYAKKYRLAAKRIRALADGDKA